MLIKWQPFLSVHILLLSTELLQINLCLKGRQIKSLDGKNMSTIDNPELILC